MVSKVSLSIPNKIQGEIKIPGSKSISNRALLLSSLSKGKSFLRDLLFSDDTKNMIRALKLLGIKIRTKNEITEIYGTGGNFKNPKQALYLGNAGTATRFLAGIACLIPGETIITGDKRMQERPIQDLLKALNKFKIAGTSLKNNGCPPISIPETTFKGGEITILANKSSQYLSALLHLAPLSTAKETIIALKGKLVSKSYLEITLGLLKKFGIKVINQNYKKFIIPPKQNFKNINLDIEADASSATYFLAIAASNQGKVIISNLGKSSVQGDSKFVNILKKMGCKVTQEKNKTTLIGPKILKPIHEINMSDMPDAALTLATLSALTKGKTKITGLSTLRIKECDRLYALKNELTKCGIEVKELKNSIVIGEGNLKKAEIQTYNDHRIAMSFSILALKNPEITILDPKCVEKTYPNFWKDLKKIGINVLNFKDQAPRNK